MTRTQSHPRELVYCSEHIAESSPGVAFALRSRELALALASRGLRIAIISPEKITPDSSLARSPNVRIVQIPCPVWVSKSFLPRVLFAIRFAWRAARGSMGGTIAGAVVAFRNPFLGALVVIALKVTCGRVYYDAPDSWLYSSYSHAGVIRNHLRRLCEYVAVHLSTCVFTVTPTLSELLVKGYHISSRKIRVVYNGASPHSFKKRRSREIDLIHLGSPRIYYDTTRLLEALRLVQRNGLSVSLVFLGCTDDPYVRRTRELVEELGLSESVRFMPPVSPDAVPEWLARARIGVFSLPDDPLFKCAIGMKVFEYMAAGLPIIHLGPSDGETANLIEQGHCGRVATTPQELAAELHGMLSDPGACSSMGAASLAVAKRFQWSAVADEMVDALRSESR